MKENKIKPIEKTEIHKQFEATFGSISCSIRALNTSKAIYKWCDGSVKPSRHKMAADFANHRKEVDKLEDMLSNL